MFINILIIITCNLYFFFVVWIMQFLFKHSSLNEVYIDVSQLFNQCHDNLSSQEVSIETTSSKKQEKWFRGYNLKLKWPCSLVGQKYAI